MEIVIKRFEHIYALLEGDMGALIQNKISIYNMIYIQSYFESYIENIEDD
jgi:hypothetical protein